MCQAAGPAGDRTARAIWSTRPGRRSPIIGPSTGRVGIDALAGCAQRDSTHPGRRAPRSGRRSPAGDASPAAREAVGLPRPASVSASARTSASTAWTPAAATSDSRRSSPRLVRRRSALATSSSRSPWTWMPELADAVGDLARAGSTPTPECSAGRCSRSSSSSGANVSFARCFFTFRSYVAMSNFLPSWHVEPAKELRRRRTDGRVAADVARRGVRVRVDADHRVRTGRHSSSRGAPAAGHDDHVHVVGPDERRPRSVAIAGHVLLLPEPFGGSAVVVGRTGQPLDELLPAPGLPVLHRLLP